MWIFTDLHAYGDKTSGILVSYWLPVMLLTLLSASLVLNKPRRAMARPADVEDDVRIFEPTVREGV